jgi:hypothetical protein
VAFRDGRVKSDAPVVARRQAAIEIARLRDAAA